MMEYFRMFLISIRTQDNRKDIKFPFIYLLMGVILLGAGIGFVVDTLIPFNFFSNMFRGVIAILTGVSLASLIYLLWTRHKEKKLMKDRFYLPIRKRLSFRQRTNVSIIVGSIVGLLVLLSSNPSPTYTIKSSLAIMSGILLVAFSRRDRDEFLKSAYEIPDIRDLRLDNEESEQEESESEDEG